MEKRQYEEMELFMLECMNDTVHDKLHVYRVVNYAAQIAEKTPGADFDIVLAAALLHDIGRGEEKRDDSVCHAKAGSKKARKYLLSKGFGTCFCEAVSQCILSHRYKKERQPESIEAKIVFDADKLDLIGNVGVARAILFGGQIDEPLYLLDDNGFPTMGQPDEGPSLFREYHRKLCHLSDRLYTKAAKEIAANQQASMNSFFEAFIGEIKGNYTAGQEILTAHLKL